MPIKVDKNAKAQTIDEQVKQQFSASDIFKSDSFMNTIPYPPKYIINLLVTFIVGLFIGLILS